MRHQWSLHVKLYFLTVAIGLIFQLNVSGQQELESYRGYILNAVDSSAIPFAHILFSQHDDMGAISLSDGSFDIKTSDDDTLIISSMIHEEVRVPVKNLSSFDNQIFLEIKNHELSDITIYSKDQLFKILHKVLECVPQNYPTVDHQLYGYYLEYSIANEEYGHLLESIMTIENQSYSKKNKATTNDYNDLHYAPHKVNIHQLRKTDDNRHLLVNRYREISDLPLNVFLKQNLIYRKALLPWSNNKTLEDQKEELNKMSKDTSNKVHIYSLGQDYHNGDTLIQIGIDWLPVYLQKSDKRMFLKSTLWTINLSDYGVINIRDQLSDDLKAYLSNRSQSNDSYGEIRYRKSAGKYYPFMVALDRGFSFMGNTQTDFVSRKFIIQKVVFDKKRGFLKGGKKLSEGKRLSELKLTYNSEFWSNINVPQFDDPIDLIKVELGRYRSLEDQFENNQKAQKN